MQRDVLIKKCIPNLLNVNERKEDEEEEGKKRERRGEGFSGELERIKDVEKDGERRKDVEEEVIAYRLHILKLSTEEGKEGKGKWRGCMTERGMKDVKAEMLNCCVYPIVTFSWGRMYGMEE